MSLEIAFLRHSHPEPVPELPAERWGLSDVGRRRSLKLALLLKAWEPQRLLTSREPKAEQTAGLLGGALGLPVECRAGLQEQARMGVPFYRSQVDFERAVIRLFENPQRVVFGEESAVEAGRRFREAVDSARTEFGGERLAIVTHGTVMSLYLAQETGEEAAALWHRWTTPCLTVLDPLKRRIVQAVSWRGDSL